MNQPLQMRFPAQQTPRQAQRHVVRVRFAECLKRQADLADGDDERVHAFRLACKRLRFALERMEPRDREMERASALLSALTDELGNAHDCAGLIEYAAQCGAPLIAERARRDRERYLSTARRLWRHAFRTNGEFAPLAAYAGFTWSLP
jgi:CHAD domain-containing protein